MIRQTSGYRLPALSGWGLRFYTCVWLILLPIALVVSAWGNWIIIDSNRDSSLRILGFDAQPPDWTIDAVWTREARAAGIRPGDQVVALDGHPIETVTRQWHVLLPLPEGHMADVALRSNGVERTFRLPSRAGNETSLYASAGIAKPLAIAIEAIALIPSAIFIAAAILLFRRRHDPVAAMLSLGFLIILVANYGGSALLATYGLYDLMYCAAPGWALFNIGVLVFPSGRLDRPWVLPTILITGLWGIASCVIPILPSGLALIGKALFPVLPVVAVATLALRYNQLSAGSERQQVRWALLGFTIDALCLAISYPMSAAAETLIAADPRWLIWQSTVVSSISMLGIAAATTGLLVSLLKYRLYDVDAAISRSVAYGALTIALVAIFAGSEKIIEIMGEEYFGESLGMLAGGLGAAVAAVMVAPLHHRLSHWAEHRFQKSLIHLRHNLPLLLSDLREMAGLDRVAAATLDAISHGVSAKRAALIVGEALEGVRGVAGKDIAAWRENWRPAAHGGLDCDRTDPVFPMRVPLDADGHGRVGWLLLGPRPDGSFYGKDERQVLTEVADPIARALEIVRQREERERVRSKQVTDVESALTTVVSRLAALEQMIGSKPSDQRS